MSGLLIKLKKGLCQCPGVVILLALVIGLPGSPVCGAVVFPAPVDVRVAILQKTDAVDFQVNQNYQLVDLSTNRSIFSFNDRETCRVRVQEGSIQVLRADSADSFKGPVALRETRFKVSIVSHGGVIAEKYSPEGLVALGAGGLTRRLGDISGPVILGSPGTTVLNKTGGLNLVTVAGKRYRGDVEFRLDNTGLTVINELPVEDYLRGVVPCEMPAGWPVEALRAQAVAVRSFVLWQVNNAGSKPFHVTADEMSQVYGGYDAECASTDKAVLDTSGMVVLYNDKPVPAFFHSSSGGYTENSEDVWKEPLPYIKGKADPFDQNNKHYNWQVTYTADQLKDQLASAGFLFEKVDDLEEKGRTATGARVERLLVCGTGSVGEAVYQEVCNADSVRKALGLKSAFFSFKKARDQNGQLAAVVFTGNGWGHGLGMSQWGALGMARKGYNYRDILAYYYNGIKVAPYGR